MKLSLTLHGKIYSVESCEDHVNLNEVGEQFKGLLVNAGFHPSNVDNLLNTDYQWFTEEERNDNLQGHTKQEIEEWQNNLFKQEDDKDYVF
jgi:hypothetical protein